MSYIKMMRNQLLEIPITTIMTILGVGLMLILSVFVVIGLLGGALKELFFYITSSPGFSTKTTSLDSDTANVLITQE